MPRLLGGDAQRSCDLRTQTEWWGVCQLLKHGHSLPSLWQRLCSSSKCHCFDLKWAFLGAGWPRAHSMASLRYPHPSSWIIHLLCRSPRGSKHALPDVGFITSAPTTLFFTGLLVFKLLSDRCDYKSFTYVLKSSYKTSSSRFIWPRCFSTWRDDLQTWAICPCALTTCSVSSNCICLPSKIP